MSTRNITRAVRHAVLQAKNHIKTQYGLLENSEVQTRTVLIDPVLRALGWDVSNPDMVRVELGRNGGFADYALLDTAAEQLLIIVEAKKLGDEKLERHIPQAAGYAKGEGSEARYSVITNGKLWRVFENGNGLMRNILAISITGDPVDRCAEGLTELLSSPWPEIATPSGVKTRRNQPSHDGIPTTASLLDAAYGPLFTGPAMNRAADVQSDMEQPPLP